MAEQEQEAIPEEVLEALEEARGYGLFNMLARNDVIRLIQEFAEDQDRQDFRNAVLWLYDNDGRYMEALTAMGARRTQ